jgi:hypothetical protein
MNKPLTGYDAEILLDALEDVVNSRLPLEVIRGLEPDRDQLQRPQRP